MMNLEKHLQELRKIEPSSEYARDSRLRIMLAAERAPKPGFKPVMAMGGIFRSGFVLSAIGVLMLLFVGGSTLKFVFNSVTGWDSTTLLAEAQAIDTQIHLANLQYNDPGYERQRLILPKTDTSLNSIAIIAGPEDSDLSVLPSSAKDNDPDSPDLVSGSQAENSTSTPASVAEVEDENGEADDADASASSTTVNVERAFEILSH